MAIWLNKETRLVVQGITGKEGKFHALGCRDYGTQVVAGVTPGKGGETVEGIPVFDSVEEARAGHRRQRRDGLRAAAVRGRRDHGGGRRRHRARGGDHRGHSGQRHDPRQGVSAREAETRLIGPNCPGIISPGQAKIGIMPGHIHRPGRVGVVSRSGTLTYEAVWQLTGLGLGQSTCVGIGGDPINGTNFLDVMKAFRDDKETDAVILIGEIGGSAEEEAAAWIQANFDRPVVGFIAGRTAPPGRRMGHAGAIVAGGKGTAAAKMEAMTAAGIHVCESPADLGSAVARALGKS